MGFFGSSFLFANIVGLALFELGLVARLGYLKRMFIRERATGANSKNIVYALMPAGLILLSFYPIFLWKGDKPLEKMFKAARQMGVRQWEAQVKTQAGLEQWADDIARKKKWKRIN